MANSLLDFVISLVRDPDAAARYAANPAQSIADAHLTDVSSADVNNLIPMVSDSLSMSGPGGSGAATPVADHGNVWASGAAAAALDSFTPHVAPGPAGMVHPHGTAGGVISQPLTPPPAGAPAEPRPLGIDWHGPSTQLTGAELADPALDHSALPPNDPGIWDHSVPHPHPADPEHHDFGIHG
ncbi:Rv0340 family IniB-related protein [Mycobacterium rhizamassiliense]|uniref:Rv0340 family IniB-related protein n=1 Tax=Mycobacterium rhizamassiliense TaxID=1841860 RepID=UPI00097DCA51|nr:IniB N-terminal domain-containing protein [Mycobacterium rhizamassiliense]